MKINWKAIGKGAAKVADIATEGTPFKAVGDAVGGIGEHHDGPQTARDHAVEVVLENCGVLMTGHPDRTSKQIADVLAFYISVVEILLLAETERRK